MKTFFYIHISYRYCEIVFSTNLKLSLRAKYTIVKSASDLYVLLLHNIIINFKRN